MKLAIVIPCYNEEELIGTTLSTLLALLDSMVGQGQISDDSYLVCVDDCSTDRTWRIIEDFHKAYPKRIEALRLTHNEGQQNVLIAGLLNVVDRCDAAVTIDADLQDEPEGIRRMVEEYKNGAEVVYGTRSARDTDTWFKRNSAHAFYKFQQMMGVEVIYDHSEFRLMSNRALKILAEYGERKLFLRNIFVKIGLPSAVVASPRSPRLAGKSKFPLNKLIGLSLDAITSFTAKPMRYIFVIGLLIVLLDIIVAIWALLSYFSESATSGWTSLILSVWFLGGFILMGIGVVGEYIGKIYDEVKQRPRYSIQDKLFKKE